MHLLAAADAANIWTALPSILWVSLLTIVLLFLHKPLGEMINQFIIRVRAGAPMKIGYVELGAIQTEQHHVAAPVSSSSSAPELLSSHDPAHPIADADAPIAYELAIARENFKTETRGLMLVHRLFRSTKPDQVYDVLIYLVPYGQESLVGVLKVEYFFGRYWGNQVFESYDRSRGFPILTSAYGTFLCCARVSLNDGSKQILFRYIDFEMGAYSPILADKTGDS